MALTRTDLLIIGAGPAGIQAAIHASRGGARTIVAGRPAKSSLGRAWIENLFCILGEVSGEEMLARGKRQARRCGVRFLDTDATSIAGKNGVFRCELEDATKIESRALILSTGITRDSSRFACGDLTGPPFQVRKAIGEGCVAGLSAVDYLCERAKET